MKTCWPEYGPSEESEALETGDSHKAVLLQLFVFIYLFIFVFYFLLLANHILFIISCHTIVAGYYGFTNG